METKRPIQEKRNYKEAAKKVGRYAGKVARYAITGAFTNRMQESIEKQDEDYDKSEATATSGCVEMLASLPIMVMAPSNPVSLGFAVYLIGEGLIRGEEAAGNLADHPDEKGRKVHGSILVKIAEKPAQWAYDKICEKWGKKEER